MYVIKCGEGYISKSGTWVPTVNPECKLSQEDANKLKCDLLLKYPMIKLKVELDKDSSEEEFIIDEVKRLGTKAYKKHEIVHAIFAYVEGKKKSSNELFSRAYYHRLGFPFVVNNVINEILKRD